MRFCLALYNQQAPGCKYFKPLRMRFCVIYGGVFVYSTGDFKPLRMRFCEKRICCILFDFIFQTVKDEILLLIFFDIFKNITLFQTVKDEILPPLLLNQRFSVIHFKPLRMRFCQCVAKFYERITRISNR